MDKGKVGLLQNTLCFQEPQQNEHNEILLVGKINGRTMEIQRLIGRALRAIVDLEALGEKTVWIDCDVIQADGGTRTASITGAFVALTQASLKLHEKKPFAKFPVVDYLAATSVGFVDEIGAVLDLNYVEDSAAASGYEP